MVSRFFREQPKSIGREEYSDPAAISGGLSLSKAIEHQFQRTSALHQQFLANQARAHSRFLAAMSQLPAATAGRFPAAPHRPLPTTRSHPNSPVETLPGPKFDRAQLEHLAEGKVSELLGPEFRPLDDRFRQTRMPMPPLLLADRVTGIDAEKASLGTGRLWTETDIRLDSWYLDAVGRMPAGVMVEAGQADLLLISWLGVDLLSVGDRVYRLLGCEVTFHTSPARPGDTLRFAISIDRHADAEETRLFFFSYDCTIDGAPAMTLNGQAGFFTDAELAGTAGLLWDPATDLPELGTVIAPPLSPARAYDETAVRAFAEGRPADCFGAAWIRTRAHIRTPRIGSGPMQLVDRVTELDPAGGPRGGGYLRAQADVSPDDWFFACHFKNDPCMPATLMFEAGVQAMQFYLAALGFTVDCDGWRYEPVPEETITLRSRGQIGPASRLVDYEVFVRELTADPYPTVRADLVATVDGLPAFHAAGVAVRLVPDWPLEHWRHLGPAGIQPGIEGFEISELGGLLGRENTDESVAVVDGVPQDYAALLSFAWGRMEKAFGPRFAPLDQRRVPRLPGPPYHFLSRITAIDGQLGDMRLGSSVTAAYDIPREAWYFTQNSCATMPLAVLMEIALQPCGWLATFVGSTLNAKETLGFRNLDGTLAIHADVTPEDRTITTRAELLRASDSGGMIVESFRVTCVSDTGRPVAELDTTF
ncbi:MAG: hypothetical protein J2P17_19310, partial [Mycobacterium sp.]|nr:hypothetical protein [Mycobacterium sp.]